MKKIILITLLLILIVSCNKKERTFTISRVKNIEIIKNNGKAANPRLNFELKELYSIDFANCPMGDSTKSLYSVENFTVDNKNNLYLLDLHEARVHKFNKDGKYLTSFCKKGLGPGETLLTTDLLYKNDTLIVADPRLRTLLYFTSDGKYLKTRKFKNPIPSPIFNFGEGFVGTIYKENAKEKQYSFNTTLFSNDMKEEEILYNFKLSLDYNEMDDKYLDVFPPFAVSENFIYHSTPLGNDYRIKVFDKKGQHIQTILKNYHPLIFSQEEKDFAIDRFNYVKGDQRFEKFPYKYKKQVNFIIPLSDNEIWVLSSIDRNKNTMNIAHLDIFKNGVFQNSISIQGKLETQDFHFRNLKYQIKNNRFYQYAGHLDKIKVFEIIKKEKR